MDTNGYSNSPLISALFLGERVALQGGVPLDCQHLRGWHLVADATRALRLTFAQEEILDKPGLDGGTQDTQLLHRK